MSKLNLGVGRTDITPEVGGCLYGYCPDLFSESVNDDLHATSFVFKTDTVTAIMITCDVCLIKTALSDKIRKCISEKYNVAFENILLSATHTHSGPNTAGTFGWGDIDKKYCEEVFIPGILSATEKAFNNIIPVKMGRASGNSYIGVNRRELKEDNTIDFGQRPWGCFNPEMTVLSFCDDNENVVANIIHYGAHGTCAGRNYKITRDWSGVMTDRLRDFTKAPSVFFNAAEGDVAPRMVYNSDDRLTQVKELGAKAAFDALEAFKSIREYKSPKINVAKDVVELPYEEIPTLEYAEKALSDMGDGVVGVLELEQARYREIIDLYKSGKEIKTHFKFNQTIIALDDIAFVPFPFEHFTEISLRLQEYAPYGYVLTLSNANGSNGYLPSMGEIPRCGYEIWSGKNNGIFVLTDNADDVIISENLRILRNMKTK